MPNRKNGKHWAVTNKIKKEAFEQGFYLTKEAMKDEKFEGKIAITLTFVQDDRRHRDLDNLLSSSKSMLDGVSKALGVDDRNFEPVTIKRSYDEERYTILELS